MRENSEHERILTIPRWVMQIIRHNAHGYSYNKQSRIVITLAFVMAEVSEAVLYILSQNFYLLSILLVSSVLFGSLLVIMFVFPIVVRKDCSDCEFGFHIIAHERTHLRLNSLDEDKVETETLKETRNRLIPLLLSNQKACKGCRFKYYGMLSQSTSEYLKKVNP